MPGVSTICMMDSPLDAALETISGITDTIEVMDDGPHFLTISEPLESFSTKFSLHAPSRGVNLASLLEPIRRASIEVMDQVFAIAAEVNAPVVIHPGYYAWVSERDRAESCLRQSLNELTRLANERGIRFFVENMGNWEYFFLKTPDEIELIGSCGFTFDVGHANQNHCVEKFLECQIDHVHLHDNHGDVDAHLAIGEGTIEFPRVLEKIKESGINPVLEVTTFEGVLESMRALERMGFPA